MYPNISVAFLTFNRSKTAIKSIRSVANDPYVKDITIFDDCSQLDEIKLIKEFCKSYKNISIRNNKKNLGYQGNLIQALKYLSQKDTDFVFVCESDMLLSNGWGSAVDKAFKVSNDSVALSVMLHKDQMLNNRSEIFKMRSLTGNDPRYPEIKDRKAFGNKCYTDMPNNQSYMKIKRHTIKYVSNSIGSLIFKKGSLKIIYSHTNRLHDYVNDEDAWLSYMCFKVNEYHPKSLMVLDPGIAFTFGEPGLHGHMFLNNLRWDGNFLWRNKTLAFIIRSFHLLRFSPYIILKVIISRKAKFKNWIKFNKR